MGWLFVGIGILAAGLFYGQDRTLLMIASIVCAVATFWSFGVMHNYATQMASRRSSYRGGFGDIEPSEADAVPNWLATLNLIFSITSAVLLGVAIYLSF